MQNMIAYIIGIFSGEIEAHPEYFIFRRNGHTACIKTVIYLSRNGKPHVLCVGNDQMPTESTIRINLLKPDDSSINAIDKSECLDAFFRYCIVKTMGRTTLILTFRTQLHRFLAIFLFVKTVP